MSDLNAAAAPSEPIVGSGRDKRAWAEEVVGELLRLSGLRVRLEVKELPAQNGGPALSVALFPEEEIAGLQPGKRSPLVESIQFLANKIVNRGPEKKWIAIGVGSHPEPRPVTTKSAPPTPPTRAPARPTTPPAPRPERVERPPERGVDVDESALEVAPDALLEAAGRRLAEKASTTGRLYAVAPMKADDRARLLRAGQGVPGASVRVEGEGRHRRVVFVPANPKPMPKRSAMPDYDIEDDSEE